MQDILNDRNTFPSTHFDEMFEIICDLELQTWKLMPDVSACSLITSCLVSVSSPSLMHMKCVGEESDQGLGFGRRLQFP